MKAFLIANSLPILVGFLSLTVAILFSFALRWHRAATSPRFQPANRRVVNSSTRPAAPGKIFVRWQDGRTQ